jgi:hypothetical protein
MTTKQKKKRKEDRTGLLDGLSNREGKKRIEMHDTKGKKKKRRCGHGVEGFYIQPAYSNLLLPLLHLSSSTIVSSSLPARITQVRRRVVHPAGQQPSKYGAMTDISGPVWSTERDPMDTR